jgi:DNA helicase-2/ATP-dependent DNA helicase PcrA
MQSHPAFVDDPNVMPYAVADQAGQSERLKGRNDRRDSERETTITQTPSELSVFFACPYQWRLRFGFGFPPPIVETIGHPDSIHAAIREYYQRLLGGEVPSAGATLLSDEELDSLVADLVARHHHAPYAPARLLPHLRAAAHRKLKSYFREYGRRDALVGETVEAVEQRIAVTIGAINIVGRYDVSTRDVEGRAVLDELKTSISAARRDPDLLVQRTYALGHEALTGQLPVRVGTRTVGATTEQYRSIEMDEVLAEDTRLRIADAERAIQLRVLPARPANGRRTCVNCDPGRLCFYGRRFSQSQSHPR